VLIGELEGLDDTDGLLDGTTDGEIVNDRSTEGTLGVDKEGTAESDTLLLEKNTVGLAGGVRAVGQLNKISKLETG
jgi:hypothetical protein